MENPGGDRRNTAQLGTAMANHTRQQGRAVGRSCASPIAAQRPKVLLIEDSAHFQNLVRLVLEHDFPQVDLHVADDGIIGLAMAGQLQPDLLLVDILLPGIRRCHPDRPPAQPPAVPAQPPHLVVTSLDEVQRVALRLCLGRSTRGAQTPLGARSCPAGLTSPGPSMTPNLHHRA